MSDTLILIPDILALLIMGSVDVWGIKYFVHVMRDDDLKNLRYIWLPNVISGGFFLALIVALFVNDVFGTYHSPFYLEIHSFLLVGSVFFALSTYRFVKTIRSHLDSKRKAAVSLGQMRSEITKRLQDSRSASSTSQDPTADNENS